VSNISKENTKILHYLQSTLSEATAYQQEALGSCSASRCAYNGEPYGNEKTDSSKLVVKDIKRLVHGALPSLVEPFISDNVVSIRSKTVGAKQGAKAMEALINYQWGKLHNPLEIMEPIGLNMMVDGTAWVLTGWGGGDYPTIEVVPFESVIPDPAAYETDDLRFVIYRRKVKISEILSNPAWYGEHTLESLNQLTSTATTSEYEAEETYGREDTFNPDSRGLEMIEVFEYYGYYDREGNGKVEPVLMIWSGDMLLKESESPFPFGPIPFDRCTYIKQPFSIYGGTINDMIGDSQRLRTDITRGIIDNMARSNNGTKFIRKGSLDHHNFNRLKNGERYVELNAPSNMTADALIYDGSFNPLPPDVYKMLSDIEENEENTLGITKYAVGSDSRSLNSTATGVGIISSMSQRRLTYMARHISAMMERVFYKWAKLNAAFTEMAEVPTPMGEIVVDGSMLPNVDDIGITITTPSEGIKEKRLNDLSSMLNAISPLTGIVGSKPMLSVLTEMAQLMEMPILQAQLMEAMSSDGVDQAKQAAFRQEMMAKQAEMAKMGAQAAKDAASAEKYQAEADKARYEVLAHSMGAEGVEL